MGRKVLSRPSLSCSISFMRLAFALALFSVPCFALEPVTDTNYKTSIYPSVNGNFVSARVVSQELRYFSQPNEENYPLLDPANLADFFKPGDYSTDSFESSVSPLAQAPIYFTYDGYAVEGNYNCVPAETDSNGEASCTIRGYWDGNGNFVDFSTAGSCGSVGIEFRGMYDTVNQTKFYQPSFRSVVVCSPSSNSLSIMGTSIYAALSDAQNAPFCFPAILLAGLLLSSMYYSGKDPLSLFDLTTPRLPRVRQFRVKAGTAPQMMRSIARRYAMLQRKAEMDILSSAKKLAAMKAEELEQAGTLGMSKRKYIRNFKEEARKVIKDYKRQMRIASASGRPLAEFDYDTARQNLVGLFERLDPGDRNSHKLNLYKYTRELLEGWFQLHHMLDQANRLTGASRGADGGGRVQKALSERVLTPLTNRVIAFEDKKLVQSIARVPLLSVLVTGPTKTFDALMQYRSTRRGAKTLRRNIHGALLYNTLLSSKDKDDEGARRLNWGGKAVSRPLGHRDANGNWVSSRLGKAVEWWNTWNFDKFEKRADLTGKRVVGLLHFSEDARNKSVFTLNDTYKHFFEPLYSLLPLASNPYYFRKAVEDDLSKLQAKYNKAMKDGRSDAEIKKIRGQIIGLQAIRNKIDAAIEKKEVGADLQVQLNRLIAHNRGAYSESEKFFKTSEIYEKPVESIARNVAEGKFTLAAALKSLLDLAEKTTKENGLPARRVTQAGLDYNAISASIMEFQAIEREVARKLLVSRDRESGFYVAIGDFKKVNDARHREMSEDDSVKEAKELYRQHLLDQARDRTLTHLPVFAREDKEKQVGEQLNRMSAYELRNELLRFSGTSALARARLQEIDRRMLGRFGDLGQAINKADFDRRLGAVYSELLLEPDRYMIRLLDLSAAYNRDIVRPTIEGIRFAGTDAQLKRIEAEFQEKLLRMNMLGNNPTGLYLINRLQLMGFVDARRLKDVIERSPQTLREEVDGGISRLNQLYQGAGTQREAAGYRLQRMQLDSIRRSLAANEDPLKIATNLARITAASPAMHSNLIGYFRQNNLQYNVRNIDDLELLFKKGVGQIDFLPQIEAAIRAGAFGSDAQRKLLAATSQRQLNDAREIAFNSLAVNAGKFAMQWESRLWITANLHDMKLMAELAKNNKPSPLRDFLGFGVTNEINKKVRAEAVDLAIQRSDFNVSQYGKETELSLLFARRYDKLAGFIAWKNMPGASWGENSLGRLESLIGESREQAGTIRAMYLQLVNPNSQFYDSKFAAQAGGRAFDSDSYQMLLNRGITFSDLRRGMPYIVAGDGRGSLPMIEWRPDVLRAHGKDIIVGKNADIRDLSPLLARMGESWYANLPVGMSMLIRHQDPGGSATWVYGDPNKDPNTRNQLDAGRSNINLREEIGLALAGFDAYGNYNPDMQKLKVISTHDLRAYAKTNEGGFFGAMTSADMFRERMRSGLYAAGAKSSELIHAGLSDRVEKMQKWFAAQMQIRFALEALSRHSAYDKETGEGFMVAGGERFDILKDDKFKERYGNNSQEVSDQLELLKRGDNSLGGNLNASWYNFRRNTAAKTVKDVADAESAWYTAKLELKALEQLRDSGRISNTDYQRHSADARVRLDEYKQDYKESAKMFKDFNNIVRGWTGSHTGFAEAGYGSIKNPFSMLWIFDRYLDSKWVQGAKTDFYQITESSAMRDPRNAIGAGYGLDYSFYVGYQTGQNVYERMSMWGTNALWESTLQNKTLPTFGVHKFFNDYMSYAARKGSAYPAWFEMDPMYPGRPGKRNLAAGFLAPLQSHYHSDWVQSRFQSFINYSGAGTLIGSYMMTGSQNPADRNFFKKAMDWAFVPSPGHYGELATWRGFQRPVEMFRHFKNRMDDTLKYSAEYRENYSRWENLPEGDPQKAEIYQKYFDPIMKVYDPRKGGEREAHSGRDIGEDGSRNRFMELYQGFHANVWKPTIPGMLDVDPITNRWKPFPQSANLVDKEKEGERLRSMATFYLSRATGETYTDVKTGEKRMKFESSDKFNTHLDAMRDVYKKEDSALLHLAKLQAEANMYSALNSPALYFFNPVAGLVSDFGIKNILARSKFGSAVKPMAFTGDTSDAFGGGSQIGFDQHVARATRYSASDFIQASQLAMQGQSDAGGFADWRDHAARIRDKGSDQYKEAKAKSNELKKRG